MMPADPRRVSTRKTLTPPLHPPRDDVTGADPVDPTGVPMVDDAIPKG